MRTLRVALTCLIILAPTVQARASSYDHAPIRYHLDSMNTTLATWWYRVKVDQAFTYWAEAGAPELGWTPTFVKVDDPAQADIRLWFRDAPQVGETCGNSTIAFACARPDSLAPLAWSIEIKTQRAGDGKHYSFDLVGDVAKHEIGHALGLPHSADPTSIMFATRDATAYGDAQPIDDWRPPVIGVTVLLVAVVASALVVLHAGRRSDDEDATGKDREDPPRP